MLCLPLMGGLCEKSSYWFLPTSAQKVVFCMLIEKGFGYQSPVNVILQS